MKSIFKMTLAEFKALKPPPEMLTLNNPNQTTVICDLAEANAFVESQGKPHVPVMSSFGAGRLHLCRLHGTWDLDLMVKDHAGVMFRSIRKFFHQALGFIRCGGKPDDSGDVRIDKRAGAW